MREEKRWRDGEHLIAHSFTTTNRQAPHLLKIRMIVTKMLRPLSAEGRRAGRPNCRSLLQRQQQQSGHRQPRRLLLRPPQPQSPSYFPSSRSFSLLLTTRRPSSPLLQTHYAAFQPSQRQQKQRHYMSSSLVAAVQTTAPSAALLVSPPPAAVVIQVAATAGGLVALKRNGRVCLSTTAAAAATAASSSSSSSSSSANCKSESGDSASNSNNNSSSSSNSSNLILDHLGTIFLTAIALVIATLVRSYYGTARKNALRDQLEADAALDPLEIQELRLANSRLTVAVFRNVMEQLWKKYYQQEDDDTMAGAVVPTMTYSEFCLAVREILQTQHHSDENPIPTIELGHYLDRVVLKLLLQQQEKQQKQPPQNHQSSSASTAVTAPVAASETPQSLTLWLIVLSLALSAPTPDRIQVLYEILQREAMATRHHLDLDTSSCSSSSSSSSNSNPIVTIAQVQQLVGYLQSTCQLVIDTQLLPTPEKKYPIQDYHQGSPQELVQWQPSQEQGGGGRDNGGKANDDDDDDAKNETSRPQNEETIDVDALAAILRSKSVCAWGECYNKKRML